MSGLLRIATPAAMYSLARITELPALDSFARPLTLQKQTCEVLKTSQVFLLIRGQKVAQ
jgi:hypothetical protein